MGLAFQSSITGMKNSQLMLDSVGNNIANLNTTGFKQGRVTFQELMYQTAKGAGAPSGSVSGTNPIQYGGGSKVGSVTSTFTQGVVDLTGRATDMAINGSGLFVVQDSEGMNMYTRNGNFSLDKEGNLVDSQGRQVLGWNAVDGKVDPSLSPEPLEIDLNAPMTARATSNAVYGGNLEADAALGTTFVSEVTVYDSLGTQHRVEVTFTKVAPGAGVAGAWDYSAEVGGAAVGTGTLAFDSKGAFDATNSTVNPFAFTPTTGADPVSVAPDFTSTSQLAAPSSIAVSNQDGFAAGSLLAFTVDDTGTFTGSYSNGLVRVLGQVATASFSNVDGLERTRDGYFLQSTNSGEAQIGAPGSGGRGTIAGGSLEGSNVDLATEFTRMITAQRAFQANSRVLSTQDQILEEVSNLKR